MKDEKKYPEVFLRVEETYNGRWFYFLLNREKEERQVLVATDDFGFSISYDMIDEIVDGLLAARREFKTLKQSKTRIFTKTKIDKEINELLYDVMSSELVNVMFFRKGYRPCTLTVENSAISLSKKMVDELLLGFEKTREIITGEKITGESNENIR